MSELTMTQKVAAWPTEFRNYVEDLRAEMRKVTWPSWKQVRATTGVVIAAVFAFAGFFFVVDFVVQAALKKLMGVFGAQ